MVNNFSPFKLLSKRLQLLRTLRERGYYVRLHAYEYLIGYENHFLAILFIEPNKRIAEFVICPPYKISKNLIRDLIKLVKEIDPYIKILIRKPLVYSSL